MSLFGNSHGLQIQIIHLESYLDYLLILKSTHSSLKGQQEEWKSIRETNMVMSKRFRRPSPVDETLGGRQSLRHDAELGPKMFTLLDDPTCQGH